MVRELGPNALQIVSAVAREPGATDWDRNELLAIAAEIERLQLADVRSTQRRLDWPKPLHQTRAIWRWRLYAETAASYYGTELGG